MMLKRRKQWRSGTDIPLVGKILFAVAVVVVLVCAVMVTLEATRNSAFTNLTTEQMEDQLGMVVTEVNTDDMTIQGSVPTAQLSCPVRIRFKPVITPDNDVQFWLAGGVSTLVENQQQVLQLAKHMCDELQE